MPFLNTLGTFSYNGYAFDGSSKIEVVSRMVRDEADATIIYQEHTYTVHATIADNTDTGQTMDDIKALLGEQARTLIVIDRGWGVPLTVGPGGVQDVKLGPKSEELSWAPIGANRACEIVWRFTVCLAYCDTTGHRKEGLMALNYTTDFSIDGKGATTRTISGYLEITQTRNGRQFANCADAYRNLIKPGEPNGFRRTQQHSVSKDKARLDFTVTDTEISSKFAFPQGCTDASGRARVGWGRANRGATKLRSTISMELEMKPGVSQAVGWSIFSQIVAQRINIAKKQGLPVLLDELSVEEDIWGRSTSYSVGYTLLRSCAACLAKHGGLWEPIGTNWAKWQLSMASVFNERGTAQLNLPAGDVIVNLCGPEDGIYLETDSKTPSEPEPQYKPVFKNELPPPQYSYYDYTQVIAPERDRPVQRQAYLQEPEATSDLIGSDPEEKTPFSFGKSGGTSDAIQEGGRSRYSVNLVGSAKRVGYPVPRPSIESVGKQIATETNFKMAQCIVGNWCGVPIYQAYWIGKYVLGNAPGEVKAQANPKEEVDKNGKAICKC